ncbi:tRNA glutamyl-Q(34) synthetase GluQRS [Sphingorhabdus arenilitoris]|uniref:tRNA glutamyl-Q(34) synthetase GluQRS n=1 Tax=Sphingorhabdus arenilitoris TaxID=1490041 RepID=A0ABV8RHT5_9SPHN
MSQDPKARIVTTRFAPSPNGHLHLGHAYAAICAHDFARAHGGRFLLRIEDIDGTRSRPEFVGGILADMQWLGLCFDGDVIFQSARVDSYRQALEQLHAMGLVYKCICTRGDIAAAIQAKAVRHGPDGPVYPGTCRGRDVPADKPYCWRLDMGKALDRAGPIGWTDLIAGDQFGDAAQFGDIVLWRKDAPASYHLAATLDDAADEITYIVRGKDLFAYTAVHRLLQNLLGLLQPAYWHHELFCDDNGEKLAKSRSSAALSALRAGGRDGKEIAQMLRSGKLPLGISLSNS